MKKIILTGLLAVSTLLQADQYLLTMSNDDKVCQHMGDIFTWDLKDSGRVVFEDIEEFKQFKWDKKLNFIEKNNHDYKVAYYDVNNDGKNEIVVFTDKLFYTNWTDTIYYFSMDLKNNNSKKKFFKWSEIHREHLFLGRTIYDYKLKEYPIIKEECFAGKERKYYPILSNPYVRAFKFENEYFIALIGNVGINTLR